MFTKEKILELIKNYKFWIIFAMILFIIYLILDTPRFSSSFEMELDRVDTLLQ